MSAYNRIRPGQLRLYGACVVLLAACRTSDVPPEVALGSLVDSSIPTAVAGDSLWRYVQRAKADFDGDSRQETAVLVSDVTLDAKGQPLWEDGHRWQVYFEEETGERTYAYSQFLPNGKLTAEVSRRPSGTLTLILLAQSPDRLSVHEVKYSGPNRVVVMSSVERDVDRAGTFSGSPRP